MADRALLTQMFKTILGNDNVYFQPPSSPSIAMSYPCIRYVLSNIRTLPADNINYRNLKEYSVTFIHKDPDDVRTDAILDIPMSKFDRRYVSDNLYHDVYSILF